VELQGKKKSSKVRKGDRTMGKMSRKTRVEGKSKKDDSKVLKAKKNHVACSVEE